MTNTTPRSSSPLRRCATTIAAATVALALATGRSGLAQPPVPAAEAAPTDGTPHVTIGSGGPRGFVRGLAFSPDGRFLYAGGWDKTVDVFESTPTGFVHRAERTLRIPKGEGLAGAIQALALSADGRWLAVGGRGLVGTQRRDFGWVLPTGGMTASLRLDLGAIWVFDLRLEGPPKALRGHTDEVMSLAFAAEGRPDGSAVLASAGRDGRVRLWEIAAAGGREVARMDRVPVRGPDGGWSFEPLDVDTRWPPALAPWILADGSAQVAVYWESSRPQDAARGRKSIHVWDAKSRRIAPVESPVPSCRALLAVPNGRGRAIAGGFGQLGEWNFAGIPEAIPAAGAFRATNRFDATLGLDRAAVHPAHPGLVFTMASEYRRNDSTGTFEWARQSLVAFDVRTGLERARRPLETDGPSARIAVSADHVAVGSDVDDRIEVLSVRDFLDGKDARAAHLGSDGLQIERISFATDANGDPGLLVEPARGAARVYDVKRRRVADDAADWKRTAPAADGWSATADPEAPLRRIVVRKAGGPATAVTLASDVVPTRIALCPPSKSCPHPIVAVAGFAGEYGREPRLSLYDGQTGRELRWYEGHTGRIAALAFSADGGLLATSASDRTVRIWSLRNLPELLDKRGRVDGLEVESRTRDGAARLTVVAGPRPLAAGDEITHLESGEFPAAVSTPWDLFHRITRIVPGGRAVLKLADGRQVEVPVTQAVDVRKPLVSLYLTEGNWIAWDETGRFDAGDESIEARLGWHFNTGDGGMPVRFGALRKYRDEFRVPGLVPRLVLPPDDPRPQPEPPPDPPRLSLRFVDPATGEDLPEVGYEDEVFLARRDEVEVQLLVEKFRLDLIDRVEMHDPRTGWTPMRPGERPGQWIGTLGAASKWDRGAPQRIGARIRIGHPVPLEFETSSRVAYQPPAPTIAVDRQSRTGDDLEVAFRVTAVEEVHLVYEQSIDDQEPAKVATTVPGDGREIVRRFRLGIGANRIAIRAVNSGARIRPLLETEMRTIDAKRDAPQAAPLIVLADVRGLDRQGEEAGGVAENETTSAVALRISGTVSGAAPDSLRIRSGDEPATGPTSTRAGPDRHEFTFLVRPKLGANRLTITAASKSGETAERAFRFVRLPFAELVEVEAREVRDVEGRPPVAGVSGFAPAGIEADQLRFTINAAAEPHPAEKVDVTVDADGSFRAKLSDLATGPNRIRALVVAKAGRSAASDPVEVFYRRPPSVLGIEVPETVKEPRTKIEATVRSFERIGPEQVLVFVNGTRTEPGAVRVEPEGRPERWRIVVPDLPLDGGVEKNDVRLEAANSHGRSENAGRATVRIVRPPAAKVEVAILSPRDESAVTVDTSEIDVEFEVATEAKLDLVRLVVGAEHPFEVRDVQPGRRRFVAKGVPLRRQANELQVHATSEAIGTVKWPPRPLVVNYVPRPVHVRVDRIEAVSGGAPLANARPESESGPPRFDRPVGQGRIVVHGRIVGAEERRPYRLKAWANGFLYESVPVVDGTFAVRLVLNRAKGNEVRLEVVGIPDDDDSAAFRVDCEAPITDQRMHLIVVGIDVLAREDEKEVVSEVVDSLQLERKAAAGGAAVDGSTRAAWDAEAWKSAAFSQVLWYEPHFGREARMKDVNTTFHRVEQHLERLRRDRNRQLESEVVLLYYRGFEVYVDGRFRLATVDYCRLRDGRLEVDAERLGQAPEEAVLGSDRLKSTFRRVRGAHLVFLDVKGADDPRRKFVADPELGVLRVADGRPSEPESPTVVLSGVRSAARSGDGRMRVVRDQVRSAVAGRPGLVFDDGLPPPLLELELVQP